MVHRAGRIRSSNLLRDLNPRQSSPTQRLKMPSPESPQQAVDNSVLHLWLLPTKRKNSAFHDELTASVAACPSLPISNPEEVFVEPILPQPGGHCSVAKRLLEADCSAEDAITVTGQYSRRRTAKPKRAVARSRPASSMSYKPRMYGLRHLKGESSSGGLRDSKFAGHNLQNFRGHARE